MIKIILLYLLTHVRTILLIIGLFGVMCLIGFIGRLYSSKVTDNKIENIISKSDSISNRFQISNDILDSISKLTVQVTIDKIQNLTKQQDEDKSKLDSLRNIEKNNKELLHSRFNEINELTKKLNLSDFELSKLKNQLNDLNSKIKKDSILINKLRNTKKDTVLFVPKPISPVNIVDTPDDNSVILKIDGRSKKYGNTSIPENLKIYLIPIQGNKRIKELMVYEIGCNENKINKFSNCKTAKFNNGTYFFKNVSPGKYLIRICYYYGEFKLITRVNGQQTVSMSLSPPIQ
jgi:hypothetical protein